MLSPALRTNHKNKHCVFLILFSHNYKTLSSFGQRQHIDLLTHPGKLSKKYRTQIKPLRKEKRF